MKAGSTRLVIFRCCPVGTILRLLRSGAAGLAATDDMLKLSGKFTPLVLP